MIEKKTFRDWRITRGYTTKYVAGVLKTKPTTLTRKERKGYGFSKLEQKLLCDLYGISLSQVITAK